MSLAYTTLQRLGKANQEAPQGGCQDTFKSTSGGMQFLGENWFLGVWRSGLFARGFRLACDNGGCHVFPLCGAAIESIHNEDGENGCDVPSCFTTFSNILFEANYDFESIDDQSIHNEDGENGCDVPSCFTTFSNILFEANYDFESIDDQSIHNEDVSEKIFSNPLFEEEIISIRIDPHHFNAESDLVESMLNRDSSVISSSLKIDSLLDEFRLLYDNSSPRPPEEFNSKNSYADIESFSPFPIPNEDSDSFMEEIDLFLTLDDPMLPSIKDDDESEGDILFLERFLHDDPIPLPDTLDFSYEVKIFLPFFTYPVTSPILLSSGSEDKIFDPGITINRSYSF
uniref:Reverse transcriptase domain-containing protein n=1 Tax=Tanacetum cinerariifolium TaxID=118510 RepID=A0A6L2NVR4_TANCI|nr:hypothetical protein [Tanacetum cinerariifolium]